MNRKRHGEGGQAGSTIGGHPQAHLHVGAGKHHFPTWSGRVLGFTTQGTTTQTISMAGMRKPISQPRELRRTPESGASSQASEKSHHFDWIGFGKGESQKVEIWSKSTNNFQRASEGSRLGKAGSVGCADGGLFVAEPHDPRSGEGLAQSCRGTQ